LIVLVAALLVGCNLAAVEPTPTLPPNRIEFITPTNNFRVNEGTELIIQLVAHDPDGVAEVELLVDGQTHQTATPVDAPTAPVFVVDMNWLAEGVGLHSMTAASYRANGRFSATTIINVEVIAADATEEGETAGRTG